MSVAKVGPIEMYYEEHGSGEPLVCIMGFATDSTGWILQTPEFSKHYRTIIFDNRGVGRTSKPAGPYSIRQMADDAVGLMNALDIRRAHVLGISMGGMIAQEIALGHPERVRGLVLACTFPEPDGDTEQHRQNFAKELGGTVGPNGETTIDLAAVSPLTLFQQLLPLVFSQSFIAKDLAQVMHLFAGALQHGFSMEAIMEQQMALMAHRTTDRLHQISAPTLVLTGDSDRLIAPANSDVIARQIPGAKLVRLPGGTHGFNIEMPDRFNAEVLGFLRDVRH
jgi:3-oxoadipate enol-lactonase